MKIFNIEAGRLNGISGHHFPRLKGFWSYLGLGGGVIYHMGGDQKGQSEWGAHVNKKKHVCDYN